MFYEKLIHFKQRTNMSCTTTDFLKLRSCGLFCTKKSSISAGLWVINVCTQPAFGFWTLWANRTEIFQGGDRAIFNVKWTFISTKQGFHAKNSNVIGFWWDFELKLLQGNSRFLDSFFFDLKLVTVLFCTRLNLFICVHSRTQLEFIEMLNIWRNFLSRRINFIRFLNKPKRRQKPETSSNLCEIYKSK